MYGYKTAQKGTGKTPWGETARTKDAVRLAMRSQVDSDRNPRALHRLPQEAESMKALKTATKTATGDVGNAEKLGWVEGFEPSATGTTNHSGTPGEQSRCDEISSSGIATSRHIDATPLQKPLQRRRRSASQKVLDKLAEYEAERLARMVPPPPPAYLKVGFYEPAIPIADLDTYRLRSIFYTSRPMPIAVQVQANHIEDAISTFAIVVRRIQIPRITIPISRRSPFWGEWLRLNRSGSEGVEHREQKLSAVVWLKSIGCRLVESESDYWAGVADVRAIDARISVECANTEPKRAGSIIRGDDQHFVMVGHNYHNPDQCTAYVFSPTPLGLMRGRLLNELDMEFQQARSSAFEAAICKRMAERKAANV